MHGALGQAPSMIGWIQNPKRYITDIIFACLLWNMMFYNLFIKWVQEDLTRLKIETSKKEGTKKLNTSMSEVSQETHKRQDDESSLKRPVSYII